MVSNLILTNSMLPTLGVPTGGQSARPILLMSYPLTCAALNASLYSHGLYNTSVLALRSPTSTFYLHALGQLQGERIRASAADLGALASMLEETARVSLHMKTLYRRVEFFGLIHASIWYLLGRNMRYLGLPSAGAICAMLPAAVATQCGHGIGHSIWIRARVAEAYAPCSPSSVIDGVVSRADVLRGFQAVRASSPNNPALVSGVLGGWCHGFYEHLQLEVGSVPPETRWMDLCSILASVKDSSYKDLETCLWYLVDTAMGLALQPGNEAVRNNTAFRIRLLAEQYSGRLAEACLVLPSEAAVHACIYAMSSALFANFDAARRAPAGRMHACLHRALGPMSGRFDYVDIGCGLVALHVGEQVYSRITPQGTYMPAPAHAAELRTSNVAWVRSSWFESTMLWCAQFVAAPIRDDIRKLRWQACDAGSMYSVTHGHGASSIDRTSSSASRGAPSSY